MPPHLRMTCVCPSITYSSLTEKNLAGTMVRNWTCVGGGGGGGSVRAQNGGSGHSGTHHVVKAWQCNAVKQAEL